MSPRLIFRRIFLQRFLLVFWVALSCRAASDSIFEKVPESDRKRANPYANQTEAIAAGSKLFSDHCAKCHGADALGRGKKPSLRTQEVQQATDGEIFWLLRNGNLRHGMPSWSSLPEPSRWQIVAYLRSLGRISPAGSANAPKGN
jgi:mono/diheme cytochrome c family protein